MNHSQNQIHSLRNLIKIIRQMGDFGRKTIHPFLNLAARANGLPLISIPDIEVKSQGQVIMDTGSCCEYVWLFCLDLTKCIACIDGNETTVFLICVY